MEWVRELKKTRKVVLLANCHVACKNLRCDLEPMTLAAFSRRYVKHGSVEAAATIVVDESSQVSTRSWHDLCALAMLGCQMLMSGDPKISWHRSKTVS